jgi:hypothetical protein
MAEKTKQFAWLRYLLGGLLLTVLLLALFYQPIIFGIAQFAGQKIAKSQAFVLQFKIHGSIFSDLSIEDVHLEPLPGNKDLPIERLDIKRIEARYDLVSLIKKDFLSVVDLVAIKDVDLIVRPSSAPPPPKEKPAIGPPKIVVIIPKKIDIQNINVKVRGDKGDIDIQKFAVDFQQGQAGYISCDHIGLPQVADWKNLKAGLSYQNSQINLTDLKLDPILDLHSLQIDLAQAEAGKFSLKLDAKALDAPVSAAVSVAQGDNSMALDASARLTNLNLENVNKIASVPIKGAVRQAAIKLSGDIDRPASISGEIDADVGDIHYQTYTIQEARLGINVDHGRGMMKEISIDSGLNRIRASGSFQLADKPEEIASKSAASVGFAIGLPDAGAYAPGFQSPTLAEGSIDIRDGRFQTYFQSATSAISLPSVAPGLSIANARTNGFVVAHFPIDEKIWPSIAAVILGGVNSIARQDAYIDHILFEAEASDGKNATVDALIHSGTSSVHATGKSALPTSDQPVDPKKIEGGVQLNIASLDDFIHQEVPGAFTVTGDVRISDLKPNGSIKAIGKEIKYQGATIQDLKLDVRFEDGAARIEASKIVFDSSNVIQFDGKAVLSEPFPYETKGDIQLTNLGTFNELLKTFGQDAGLAGQLVADWTAKGDGKQLIPQAEFKMTGNHIKFRGLEIQDTNINASVVNQKLDIPTLKIVFNSKNSVDATANASLSDPYPYDGSAKIAFQDLGFLNELIKSFGQDLGLGGKLIANWAGKSEARNSIGSIEIHGEGIKTKAIQGIKADLTGNYSGMNAEIPRLQIATPYADLDASLRLSSEFFEIPTLTVAKNGNSITGNVKIPVNLQKDSKSPLNLDGPLYVDIRADKIALASFQPGKAAMTGTVGFRVQASKTARDPQVEISAQARDIRASAVPSFKAVNSDFLIRLADKVLSISGKVQQPDINPMEITGRVPLDTGRIIETGNVPDDTPLALSVKWPNNNLAFIRKIVPYIKILEGTANVDINVAGTVKQPQLAGVVQSSITRFQANTDAVPPLSDFLTNISFKENRIQIDQLKGLAGGGPFDVGGAIDLADGKNPKFDIGINGKQVLLTRSDGLIARSNFALKVQGPLSAGVVNGTVGVTNSRFYKDIDILPLNLPGRPPPQPPSGAPPKVAIDTPPFKDWKFDIAIKTDEPILIQSNLARGQISINLHAGGTGAAPSVTGAVTVDRLVASLPFSKMEIKNGTINFVEGANIFNPSLSIVGQSAIRDYEVRARIFGTVDNPTVLLDSSPPLAQGDILVLLATGSTTSEFAQNPDLLVGRASFIVIQQLLGKFFPSTNRADEQKEPFIDRFDVEIIPGRKAGDQEISTRFKLTDNWQIIGDIGSTSYQGRLKYLLRFR